MIVSNLQPLEITEDPNFLGFINALHTTFQIPTKSEMRSLLMTVYKEKEKELQNTLASVDDVTLTCELWSSRPEDSYLTASAHFVDNLGNLRSYTLQTTCLFGDESAANIQNQLTAIMEVWGIKEKVHTVVRAGMPQMKRVKVKWRDMPCFADTLNMIFKDLMGNDELSNVLRKCQDIIRFFKYNSDAERKLREIQQQLGMKQEELILCSGDQWFTWLHMLEQLHRQYWTMMMVIDEQGKTDLNLNENDKRKLDNIISALKPLREATSMMKGKGFETISVILPLLMKVMAKLKGEEKQNDVARALLSKCKKKFGDINNHQLAPMTFLDPRYKNQLGEQNKKQAIEKITKELTAGQVFSAAKVKAVLKRYLAKEPNAKDSNPLAWWRFTGKEQFGDLSKLALKKLGVVSTALPLERASVSTGERFSNFRSSIEPEILHMTLFLHNNWCTNS
ncbi:Zinc finger BED domain-containing protein 1 [Channa argus]|uniref:Zinc finger BED domain-containing protein 1 n=2 Tax=Channa argus TaxID=215402 RepID=A0A6G1PJN1_CHAAH|nr:Zinc finger BED domain-containing protein 1 [Channa argus]KAK2908252.1 hypothetical protein Q8A73_009325 [Channa argus]